MMRETHENSLDFGSIQIHKKALADIAVSAIDDLDGVTLVPSNFKTSVLSLFGCRNYTGIHVTIDKDNQVSIEAKVLVRYGVNIPEIGRRIQEAVRTAVERIADINLKDIHVDIQGIERGNQ